MYELKKIWKGIYLLGPGPRLRKKRIHRAAVSQRLRNTALNNVAGKQICRELRFLFVSVSLTEQNISFFYSSFQF